MNEERVRQIVRQFPENGLKQVLCSPGNVRDLLHLTKVAMLSRIDLEGMAFSGRCSPFSRPARRAAARSPSAWRRR